MAKKKLPRKLVDRSAFGEIFKINGTAGISDVYHVVPSEGRIIRFKNTRGCIITGKDVYLTSLFDARRLIGKTQNGHHVPADEIVIPAGNVVSDLGILDRMF